MSRPLHKLDVDVAGKPHSKFLRECLRRAYATLASFESLPAPPSLKSLSIALVDDAEIARLHQEFMGIQGSTDVLTFEMEHDDQGRVSAGEVVICVPYARREVCTRKTELKHELLLYAVHGMLHLCGYDDRTPADYEMMHRREDEILTALGVGPVFHAKADKNVRPTGGRQECPPHRKRGAR